MKVVGSGSKRFFCANAATEKSRFPSTKTLPNYVLETPMTKITTLANGMRVATEEGFGKTGTVGVWIGAGSAFEDNRNNGTAHFLEHMAFKGSDKRTKKDLEMLVEMQGGMLNAYTTREHTVYVMQGFRENVPVMVDILSDMLQRSLFKTEDIEYERSVINEEKTFVEKNIEEVVFDYLHMGAFEGTSLGLTILGQPVNINAIQQADLLKYIQTHYTAPRMVLVGAGAVKHELLVELAEQYFSNLKPNINMDVDFQSQEVPFHACDIRDDSLGKADEMYIALGFEGVGWSHPNYFVFMMIQFILGKWESRLGGGDHIASHLARAISKNQLAQSFQTYSTNYKNCGLFGVSGVVHAEHSTQFCEEVLKAIRELPDLLTDELMEATKVKVKINSLMNLDGSYQIAEDIGRQILTLGRRLTPAEVSMRVDAITKEDLITCLNDNFVDASLNFVAIGPQQQYLPTYDMLQKWTRRSNFE
jgi:processing peptidase subunit beta